MLTKQNWKIPRQISDVHNLSIFDLDLEFPKFYIQKR